MAGRSPALKLFYYIEKHVVKAKVNPIWKNYLRANRMKIDENPQIVEDLLILLKSSDEYRVICK